jgi:hypothetical protein
MPTEASTAAISVVGTYRKTPRHVSTEQSMVKFSTEVRWPANDVSVTKPFIASKSHLDHRCVASEQIGCKASNVEADPTPNCDDWLLPPAKGIDYSWTSDRQPAPTSNC